MKLLLIYSNIEIISNNLNNTNYDIFIDKKCKNINDLYYKSIKKYYYYLFLDKNIDILSYIDIIIEILFKNIPVILELNYNLKIYHRSIIHYIFPIPKEAYEDIYYFMNLIEQPISKYKYIYQITKDKILSNKYKKIELEKYFKKFLINYYVNNINTVKIEYDLNVNFMNFFNPFKYYNMEHDFFKNKIIKFHKNNREIHGDCGTYHFLHDFRNANRNAIINHLIHKYNYESYLEIGVYNCYHFADVLIKNKIGVDPSPQYDDKEFKIWEDNINIMTSIEFFNNLDELKNNIKFDIIFIDGCLDEKNIFQDIKNSLRYLNINGTIVIHDCNPPIEYFQRDIYNERYNMRKTVIWNNKEYTDRHWNGKVWKSIIYFNSLDHLDVKVVDTDWGIGIIKYKETFIKDNKDNKDINNNIVNNINEIKDISYDELILKRKELLNLITVDEFINIY